MVAQQKIHFRDAFSFTRRNIIQQTLQYFAQGGLLAPTAAKQLLGEEHASNYRIYSCKERKISRINTLQTLRNWLAILITNLKDSNYSFKGFNAKLLIGEVQTIQEFLDTHWKNQFQDEMKHLMYYAILNYMHNTSEPDEYLLTLLGSSLLGKAAISSYISC